MTEVFRCWICGGDFSKAWPQQGDVISIDCTTCGAYRITESQYNSDFPIPFGDRFLLAYWCKQRQLDKLEPSLFRSDTVSAIASGLPRPDPSERADLLLVSLAKKQPGPGQFIQLDSSREYSLACAENPPELLFHLESLRLAGMISAKEGNKHQYRLLAQGWARVNELRATPSASRMAFVAMSFSDDMLALWEPVFVPAIQAAGYKAERSGNPAHNDRIDAQIVAAIRKSKFVVADVTHGRNGVYFEAGYALGMRLPVIWSCRKDRETNDMHFDTRQYNHILWNTPDDLATQLTARIIATI